MKRTSLLLTLIFALLTEVSGQYDVAWQIIPSGVSENLYSVHFANSNAGYIGGAGARCLKSTNEGKNWASVSVPSVADFQTVWATSPGDAYLGGWDTVYATHNGGQSWYDGYTNSFLLAVNDLQFLSPDNGYAFMQFSSFVKTANAGSTWSEPSGSGIIEDYLAGFMLNQSTGFVVGQCGHIARTDDGGATWVFYEWNNYADWSCIDIYGLHFTSAANGYAVADSGVVFRTTDGGNYWSRTEIAGPEDRLTDVYFLNANIGWISGYNGLIFKTTDGGDNWVQEPQMTFVNLHGIFFISESLGWAVGDEGVILRYGVGGPSGLGDIQADSPGELLAYPNPAGEYIEIELILRDGDDYFLQLLDQYGRTIKEIQQSTMKPGKYTLQITLAGLPDGAYLCRLTNGKGAGIDRMFVKQ